MGQMKGHCLQGRELMRRAGVLSSDVAEGALQHHERMDGSGYPTGLIGKAIHPYARIIAVADVYDAMTSERPYQRKQSPFSAARAIALDMFSKLDMETATTFLEHMRDHFIGSQICLTDGRLAEVILLGGDFTFKPIIRTQGGEFLDMSRNPAIMIKEVVTA
jgi:HD-GYP domain-containing protein (c-di-GMP phosphodiesterase class II)